MATTSDPAGFPYPSEAPSRLAGWCEGTPLVLGNGEVWYLPRIDDGLIPHLRDVTIFADGLAGYLDQAADGGQPDPELPIALASFVAILLGTQYRVDAATLARLVMDTDEGQSLEIFAAATTYLGRLAEFRRRLPAATYPTNWVGETN